MLRHCWNSYTGFLFVNGSSTSWPYWHSRSVVHQPQRMPRPSHQIASNFTSLWLRNAFTAQTYYTRIHFADRAFCCTATVLQSGIRLAMTLVLHLLYLSLSLRHSYSVRHLGLVGSHDRNLPVSASGVFDILALYQLDCYYYYYYYYYNAAALLIYRLQTCDHNWCTHQSPLVAGSEKKEYSTNWLFWPIKCFTDVHRSTSVRSYVSMISLVDELCVRLAPTALCNH